MLPQYDLAGHAYAVSADGSVVVGEGECDAGSGVCSSRHAFRWTRETGTVGLGGFKPNTPYIPGSYARGVTADGEMVVGMSSGHTGGLPPTFIRAAWWTEQGGWEILPGTPPLTAAQIDVAYGVSADGSVVVGTLWENLSTAPPEAFRWTAEEAQVRLGTLPGSDWCEPSAVSADGTVVVGYCTFLGVGTAAFRWTAGEGMQPLGDLPGGSATSTAFGVSGNGSVIVGASSTDLPGGAAFIWDQEHGMRQLHAVLTDEYALDLQGWTLGARAITPDGRTIVGSGINPKGQREGWIVHLGPPCAADWNADGSLDSDDFFAFLGDFFAAKGDFNGDGVVDSDDYFAFLESFFEGCP